jgi:hypothetical protein
MHCACKLVSPRHSVDLTPPAGWNELAITVAGQHTTVTKRAAFNQEWELTVGNKLYKRLLFWARSFCNNIGTCDYQISGLFPSSYIKNKAHLGNWICFHTWVKRLGCKHIQFPKHCVLKSTIFWENMPCSLSSVNRHLGEHAASIFRVKY